MDTLITLTVVSAAGLWGAASLYRRFWGKRAATCAGSCSGCPAGRPERRTDRSCSETEAPSRRDPLATGISLPSRGEGRR